MGSRWRVRDVFGGRGIKGVAWWMEEVGLGSGVRGGVGLGYERLGPGGCLRVGRLASSDLLGGTLLADRRSGLTVGLWTFGCRNALENGRMRLHCRSSSSGSWSQSV